MPNGRSRFNVQSSTKKQLDRNFQVSGIFETRDRRCRSCSRSLKRFGLCVLNYMVTSNHVHLLVKDTGSNVIAESMQLIAGRTAQEYNQRKSKQGAFWEDRYHATRCAKPTNICIVVWFYIDLNMVRAGVVTHPFDWVERAAVMGIFSCSN
jgi:putative transposase